ncbi:MAG TPA: CheR family methyltransferase [Steroidobacteraceae bacterium]|nr:CheR family methyltransferase [Steroidobacteraceae bacterium]
MTMALAAAEIEGFRSLVAQGLGLYFDDAKLDFLADVVQRRMAATGCELFSSYRKRIASLPTRREEIRTLAEQLTVNETYFFRYGDHFRAFAEVIVPNRIQARGNDHRFRILSAGCASGEEAYTLAILIRERYPQLASWDIGIHGIDVNALMVGKAIRAKYSAWSLRDTSADVQMKYFRADGRDFFLDGAVKRDVTFEERNLVEEDPSFWQSDAFDVVLCRNVTMYFTSEIARSVIARIARSIVPGGFLFLGHAENLRGVSQEFHLRHTHETFYYQRRETHEMDADLAFSQASAETGAFRIHIPAGTEPDETWFNIIRRASDHVSSLTQEKSGPTASASVNVTPAPDTRANAPAAPWDRTLALELLRKERFAEAAELLQALPAESKADPDTQLLLAVLLTNGGDLPEAEKVCLNVLMLDELNAGAHYLMALCREHAGDRDGAMEHDQAATYLDAAFAMPHLHLGLVAKRSADMETARRELGLALPLLAREDASRILLFGGGFTRGALIEFCQAELCASGGAG